jgi:hypothetical protein
LELADCKVSKPGVTVDWLGGGEDMTCGPDEG